MNKKILIDQILSEIKKNLSILKKSAKMAYEASTHEENIAEDKYDTRGVEASYLAAGQAERIEELALMINSYNKLKIKEFAEDTPISLTAIIELENEENRSLYFMGPLAGGMEISFEGETITIITPQSPLGKKLLGKFDGDTIEIKINEHTKEYDILSVI